jgi:radical SAM protein with 4Fe4S-binding SPASM domain
MQEIQYKTFSLKAHKKNWHLKSPNACQFELTFKCGIHCKHCYTDCYNKQDFTKDELNTKQVKSVLDKVYSSGVIWLCFTGGDPLARKDFLEIYFYAKTKGFIVSVFTNGCSMTKEIADHLKENPPFVIEITLNAVTKKRYEQIAQVKGSFEKAMNGISLIARRKLPLKIKTQVTKDNLKELPEIKKFVEDLGLKFNPSFFLHARLDQNLTPCSLRIKPKESVELNKRLRYTTDKLLDDACRSMPNSESQPLNTSHHEPNAKHQGPNCSLFSCTINGGDGMHIDPYGNLIPCVCIREPKINLCRKNIKEAQINILTWVRSRSFTTDSKCKGCKMITNCHKCPGQAMVEKGNLEAEIEWFCELAKLS